MLDDARLAQVVLTPQYPFPGAGEGFGRARPTFMIGNHNRLLGSYDGLLGLKNGYTDAARGSLVAAAERDGRRLVAVVLRAEGSEADQCAALMDWAFALPETAEPVTTLQASVDSAGVEDVAEPEPGAAQPEQRAAPAATAPAPRRSVPADAPREMPVWLVSTLVVVGLLLGAVVFLRLTRDVRIARRRARRAAAAAAGRPG